jgi:hypothetical protein
MNCALIRICVNQDPPWEMSKVMLLYSEACQEQRDTPHQSQAREVFIQEWMKPESVDIFVFSQSDMRALSKAFSALHSRMATEAMQKEEVDVSDINMDKMELEDPHKTLTEHYKSWADTGDTDKTSEEHEKMDDLIEKAIDWCLKMLANLKGADTSAADREILDSVLGIANGVRTVQKVRDCLADLGNLSVN